MIKTRAIIFDLDNTLVNRQAAFRAYSEQFIKQFVSIADEAERANMLELMRIADRDGYRHKRELYGELREQFNIDSNIAVDELLQFWFQQFSSHTVLMDGAVELLTALKDRGIKLGLITNGSVISQYAKIDRVGLRSYFDTIIVSDEVGCKKPDKKIFELAVTQLDVEPRACIFVGDHPINDVHGAREAGLQPVWLQGFRAWEQQLTPAPHTITSLAQVLQLLDVE